MGRFFGGGGSGGAVDADNEAAERSRVQLVSSRRRPSAEDELELEANRSSTLSHISYLSTPALGATSREWQTPRVGQPLAKTPSFRQQFHDDRCSLPTLESFRSTSGGPEWSVETVGDTASTKGSKAKSHRRAKPRANVQSQPSLDFRGEPLIKDQEPLRRSQPEQRLTDEAADAIDAVYFAPHSPPQSVSSTLDCFPTV